MKISVSPVMWSFMKFEVILEPRDAVDQVAVRVIVRQAFGHDLPAPQTARTADDRRRTETRAEAGFQDARHATFIGPISIPVRSSWSKSVSNGIIHFSKKGRRRQGPEEAIIQTLRGQE
jgi:hypothetical protein